MKTAWQTVGLGVDWFFETDDQVQWFGPDDPLTQEVRYSSAVDAFRDEWAEEEYRLPFSWEHQMDEREGPLIPRVIGGAKEYIVANCKLGLSFVGLGSFSPEGSIDAVDGVMGSFDRISVSDAGNGMIRFEAMNITGLASGTRIPGTNISLLEDRDRSDWGPGGTLRQHYYWWEQLYYSPGDE